MTLINWVIPIRLVDLVEILLIALVLYKLYQWMRGTIAVQISLGILALFLLQGFVTVANMRVLRPFFESISQVFMIAVLVLFQPEIRRLLLLLGRNPLVQRFVPTPQQETLISEVVAAVSEMSKAKIGGLLVFERTAGLRSYIETGALLHAKASRDLIITIFHGQNPLHDGATILRNGLVEAARCILPVSTSMKLSPNLGLRHRAAVGLSEQTDAFVIVVSEETGQISVALNGDLFSNLTINELRTYLKEVLKPKEKVEDEGKG